METALENLSRNELLKLAKEKLAAERAYLHQANMEYV